MRIQFKLWLLTISIALVAMAVTLLVSTYLTREALETDAKEKLAAVLEARHNTLTRYLDTIHRELHVLAEAPATIKSLAALSEGYAKLGGNAQTLLQQNYSTKNSEHKNPKPSVLQGSDYDRAHAATQAFMLQRHEYYEWQDIFLVDTRGNVVFSFAKHDDFATNLLTGPWKDTGLAHAVVPLLRDAVLDVMSYTDFSRYAANDNKPASFLAMPVFDPGKQVFLGVVAIQLPVQQVNELMKDKTGMGESGETFVVGKGGWMLTDSRFGKESSILSRQLKTKAVSRVLDGESGLEQYPDYRGIDAFVAFKPLQPYRDEAALGDRPLWGVIAKIDREEVLAEYYQLRLMLLLTGGVLVVFAFGAGIWRSRGITRPLLQIKDALTALAKGRPVDVPCLERSDEIGEMAVAAEAFREMARRIEHEHWVAESVASLTDAVSAESIIDKAADRVLHLLCGKLDVPVGAVYLLYGGQYRMVGAHGLARCNQDKDAFMLGEGVLGQCAKDNRAVVVSPVPADLSVISTGLAEFPPHELAIYPIAHKGEVLAVLELGAARPLDPGQHEFLEAASGALGLHLANLQASEHNLVLLAETRKQSRELKEQQETLLKSNEEMRAMTEELRSQSEEMKAQNEELRANQEELRAQQEEMKQKNLILETQSAQLKELLRETETKARELQRANQYKSEFLANMSHELRTPLNSVLILSKNLAENQENNLSPEQVESATVIGESGAQLLTLIDDILDLSKIEAGKIELVKEEFRLDDMLAYLRRIFAPQAGKKRIAFNIEVAAGLPETIHTDRQRLTQVLTNLLSNAVKFTGSGEVKVLAAKAGEDLQFEVIDTGIGIPADKMEHIFGAFQQADGSTSRKYGGTGLGLAISRHLAELLGGEVAVSSQPGKGSSFTVRLFKQFAKPEGKPPPGLKQPAVYGVAAAASDGGNILVVEDDTRLLAILERMIKALGFTPVCAASAEQALREVGKALPAGILLDLGLPKMSGIEFLHRLKEDRTTSHIPVFIMSGATDSGEAKVLGALGFLKKPVTRDSIAAAIKTMVAAEHAIFNSRVLLAGGEPGDAESIGKLFCNDPVEIIHAGAGADALRLLQTQHFDTVILDLELPDTGGFEWLKQAAHCLNPPPVVIYSAHELSEEEVFELKGVAESIVTKSPSSERLHEEVLLALHLDIGASKLGAVAAGQADGKKLLLVDDDARNLFALTKVLRAKGYAVEVASDGARALEMLALGVFDAVLTDIMMPEMDGYALIRQIRELGYADIPIFAITAKAMQGDAELCIQAGATAYFAKPVDVDGLVDMIEVR